MTSNNASLSGVLTVVNKIEEISAKQREYLVQLVQEDKSKMAELAGLSEPELRRRLISLAAPTTTDTSGATATATATAAAAAAAATTSTDTSSSSSSAAASTEAEVQQSPLEAVRAALDTMLRSDVQHATLKSSLRFVAKLLRNLLKDPTKKKHRRVALHQFMAQKALLKVKGAFALATACGFVDAAQDESKRRSWQSVEVPELSKGEKRFLEYEDAENLDVEFVEQAADLLEEAVEQEAAEREALKTAAADGVRKRCKSCSFFGDPETEGYCSMCYKKTFLDGKSSSSSSSAHPSGGAAPAQEPAGPPQPCIKDCGFYGQKKWDGMCSMCFKTVNGAKTWRARLRSAKVKLAALHRFRKPLRKRPPRKEQKNKKRCWKCRRRVGILGYDCKCGYIFCSEHRYVTAHDCQYDVTRAHQKKLNKENKVIGRDKMDRIDDD